MPHRPLGPGKQAGGDSERHPTPAKAPGKSSRKVPENNPRKAPDNAPANASSGEPNSADEVVLAGSLASGSRRSLAPGPGGKIDADSVRELLEAADESDDAELRRVRFELQRDLQKRLDKYLTDRISFTSRTQLQRLIDEGGVLVNNRLPKASTVLRAGDVVEVVVPPPPEKNIQPEDIPLDVLYEDANIIVLNKQPDIIVHPARTHLKGTMLSALEFHFRHRSPQGGQLSKVGEQFARPGVVHRLDRHTSGCIVFAKQDEAHWKLGHQFEHRRVQKRYLAVVHGRFEPAKDLIDLPIGPHPSREKGYREKYVVRHDEQGKSAQTTVRVREWYTLDLPPQTTTPEPALSSPARQPPAPAWGASPLSSAPAVRSASTKPLEFSLVELELHTGRTHQIRVHLSYLGFPIVGDDMYDGKPFPPDDWHKRVAAQSGAAAAEHLPLPGSIIQRQALHAAMLGFTHPIDTTPLLFTAPLRGDIAALVAELRARCRVERPEVPGTMIDLQHALGNKPPAP
ncbi:MAG: RluA family pseudouridine synthase [Planctomycetota bacterium]|nr:RluA family pseudouridine synthase [Planctomycetota bacterium]